MATTTCSHVPVVCPDFLALNVRDVDAIRWHVHTVSTTAVALRSPAGQPSWHPVSEWRPAAWMCRDPDRRTPCGRTPPPCRCLRHVTPPDGWGKWFLRTRSEDTQGELDDPSAYKDIRAVLRAQHDLVKVTRTLRPVLNYKGVW